MALSLQESCFKSSKLADFSDDIWLSIFSFLEKQDLCLVATVNKTWARISCDPSLWREINLKCFSASHCSKFLKSLMSTRLAGLRSINLAAIHISFNTLRQLWTKCRKLEVVIFGRNSRLEKHGLSRYAHVPAKIKTLDLRLVKGDFEFLLASGYRLQGLENFGLGRGSYSMSFFPHLFLRTLNLKVLDLTNCENVIDDQMEYIFTQTRNLESLCMIGCRKLKGAFFPEMIENCPRLRTLLVRYLPITDTVVCSCDWQKLSLEELDISACPEITWVGLSSLVSKLHSIRYLNMSYCGIGHAVTDAVLCQLLTNGIAGKLQMLDIRWSFLVSAPSLQYFLKHCQSLQYLGIYQSNGVTSNVISEMAVYLKELRIVEFGGLRPEILTSSQMLQSLQESCKHLSTLSLINFCSINKPCDESQFAELIGLSGNLVRINLCDCSDDLVLAAKEAAKNSAVLITEKWECALPPPAYTLDSVIRKNAR